MSDTPDPQSQTSPALGGPAEFDARLKRLDEPRWLSSRYAPADSRPALVALYLLHNELGRALSASEAMLGKIRIQWWREALAEIGEGRAVRRHDLAQELERTLAPRKDVTTALNALVDAFDDVLDDHLHSGHQPGGDHAKKHLATEGALIKAAGVLLHSTASKGELEVLAKLGEAHLARLADLTGADAQFRWAARTASGVDAPLWPAVIHYALWSHPSEGPPPGPLATRWRLFRAMLSRKL